MNRYNRYTVSANCGCDINMNSYSAQRANDGSSLAMVSIPMQEFRDLHSPCEALERGTLFAELYMPYCIRGGCR